MSAYSSRVNELFDSLFWGCYDAKSFGQQSILLMSTMRDAGLHGDPIPRYQCDYMLQQVRQIRDANVDHGTKALAINLEAFLEHYRSI
jgi:hypothetical protein